MAKRLWYEAKRQTLGFLLVSVLMDKANRGPDSFLTALAGGVWGTNGKGPVLGITSRGLVSLCTLVRVP